ncbi:MAG: hypothetical protein P1U37_00290 [Minwuia sp.]|nr:hypothetical protein [Minwuia sp.]
MMRPLVLALLVLTIGISACGKKGEPLTPSESARQQAAQEKKQQQESAE